jgi:hypothetical protein
MALRVGTMIVGVFGTVSYWWAARRRSLLATTATLDWHPIDA